MPTKIALAEALCHAAERRDEALGALKAVLNRIHGTRGEHWLMGEPHPPMMTLGQYLRAAIERTEHDA